MPPIKLHPSVPQGLTMAFYKGTRPGIDGVFNKIGRYLDTARDKPIYGPYSHTELIFSNGLSGSSSIIDHGVRMKPIGYSSVGSWDFMPIPDPEGKLESAAMKWYFDHYGEQYDYAGNLRFATGIVRDHPERWFCIESNLASLGVLEPYRFSPSGGALLCQQLFDTQMIIIDPLDYK